jgi:hypothetical protein
MSRNKVWSWWLSVDFLVTLFIFNLMQNFNFFRHKFSPLHFHHDLNRNFVFLFLKHKQRVGKIAKISTFKILFDFIVNREKCGKILWIFLMNFLKYRGNFFRYFRGFWWSMEFSSLEFSQKNKAKCKSW